MDFCVYTTKNFKSSDIVEITTLEEFIQFMEDLAAPLILWPNGERTEDQHLVEVYEDFP